MPATAVEISWFPLGIIRAGCPARVCTGLVGSNAIYALLCWSPLGRIAATVERFLVGPVQQGQKLLDGGQGQVPPSDELVDFKGTKYRHSLRGTRPAPQNAKTDPHWGPPSLGSGAFAPRTS